jgi:prepilin-type N-terminal cleavage/methylation domain-containing protein
VQYAPTGRLCDGDLVFQSIYCLPEIIVMMTLRLLTRQYRTPSHPVSGFTLPEVLVATLIAAGIVVITAQLMINQLLEERRLEVAQRLREDVSRLNYLIQIEASEAEEIAYGAGANPVGCPGGGDSFTFLVPRPTGTYADDSNRSRVQYYNANDAGIPSIWRCGPPVTRNGVLIHNANPVNTAGIVMRNAQLNLDPSSTARGVTYQVVPTGVLPGGNLGDLGGLATAFARSVFVCNPPVGAGGAVGDCP